MILMYLLKIFRGCRILSKKYDYLIGLPEVLLKNIISRLSLEEIREAIEEMEEKEINKK